MISPGSPTPIFTLGSLTAFAPRTSAATSCRRRFQLPSSSTPIWSHRCFRGSTSNFCSLSISIDTPLLPELILIFLVNRGVLLCFFIFLFLFCFALFPLLLVVRWLWRIHPPYNPVLVLLGRNGQPLVPTIPNVVLSH